MIISHKYKVIFIHIPKNAGTFITQLLHNLDENLDCTHLGHMTAKEGKSIVEDKIWNNYTKICVIRNSWDLSLSFYYYIKQTPNHHLYEFIHNKTFSEFLSFPEIHYLQCYFLLDNDNKIMVNFLIDFNNLENNLIKFLNYIIKIDLRVIMDALLNDKINKSDKLDDYTLYYDKTTIELVNNIHKTDIEFFNFKFGDISNDNILYPNNQNDVFGKRIETLHEHIKFTSDNDLIVKE